MTGPKTPYPDSTLDDRAARPGSPAESAERTDEAAVAAEDGAEQPDADDIRAEAARRGAQAALSRWPLP